MMMEFSRGVSCAACANIINLGLAALGTPGIMIEHTYDFKYERRLKK